MSLLSKLGSGLQAGLQTLFTPVRPKTFYDPGSPFTAGFDSMPWVWGGVKRMPTLWLQSAQTQSQLRGPIHVIARDIAKVEWHLYRRNPENPNDKQLVNKHPFLDLVDDCNPWLSWHQIRELQHKFRLLVGERFMWLRRDEFLGPIKEFWPIPPHWCTAIPQFRQLKNGDIVFDPFFHFNFGGQSEPQEMLFTEILWSYEPDLLNPYTRGVGSAVATADTVMWIEQMEKYQLSFFRNAATPSLVVGIDGASEAEIARVKQWWNDRHQGFSKAFMPAFVNKSKFDIKPIGQSHEGMQFDSLLDFGEKRIARNFTVPPELLGIMAATSREALEAAMCYQNEHNVLPELLKDRHDYNRYLLALDRENDPNLYYDFVNPVKDTADFRLKRSNEGLSRGVLTVDEWRIDQGYVPLGPDNGGSDRFIPVNVLVQLPDGTFVASPNASQEGQPVGVTGPRKAMLCRTLDGKLKLITPDGLVEVTHVNGAISDEVVLVP